MNKLKSRMIYDPRVSEDDPYARFTARDFMLRCLITAAVCFIASFGRMAGYPSYMSVACAVISGKYSPAAFLGVIAGCAVRGNYADSAVQLGAIMITSAMNVFFPNYSKNGDPIRLSLFTASVNLLLSCVAGAVAPQSFPVSMRMVSSLLCACVVYAAAFVIESASTGKPLRIQGLSAVYLSMLYIAAVATLSSCSVGIFNLGRVFGCAVIPTAAKKRRAAGGAVMGALTAVSITMCSSYLSANAMLLAAAGLICSAFCDLGRLAAAISFMLSASAALATSGLNSDTFNMLADIIAGTALFAAVPADLFGRAVSGFLILNNPADSAGQTASSRLTFASMTISDIKDKLTLVSNTVEARADGLTLGERVVTEACSVCRLCDECRQNGCSNRLAQLCDREQQGDNIRAAGCIRSGELAVIIGKCREDELADRAEAARLKEMRILLREQLGSMSDILNDLSCRLSRRREIDSGLSASAKSYFEREGFSGVRACVYVDENRCRRAEIYLSGNYEPEALSLTAGLCRALECDFELPGITSANRITKLEFDEIPPFRADLGSYSASGSDDSCSGDSLETVECSAGEKYLLLSDGMGSGKRARLDSAMSVSLAGHMLRSGMTMTTSQRIINSVMRVKDWEESFATLDFLRLDLFAGRAEFLKSGAAPAYLCRDGGLMKIDCDSYPAGILSSCEPNVSSCKLFDGDVLVLASDGAPEAALRRSPKIIMDNADADARSLAYLIGSLCSTAAGEKCDDITVAVVKISYKKEKNCVRA